jgi:glutaredoxin
MRQFIRLITTIVLAACVTLSISTEFAQAEIYKWTDSNGKTHYSDAQPAEQKAETVSVDDINTFTDVSISDAPEWKGFYQPEIKPRVKNVVMYSTQRCGYCKKARRYFSEHGIAFTEKLIDSDKAAYDEYKQLNATGVPVILIGRKRLNGFSESAFEQLYY